MGKLLYVFQIHSIGFYVFNVDGTDYEVGVEYIVIYGGCIVSLTWDKKCLCSEGELPVSTLFEICSSGVA